MWPNKRQLIALTCFPQYLNPSVSLSSSISWTDLPFWPASKTSVSVKPPCFLSKLASACSLPGFCLSDSLIPDLLSLWIIKDSVSWGNYSVDYLVFGFTSCYVSLSFIPATDLPSSITTVFVCCVWVHPPFLSTSSYSCRVSLKLFTDVQPVPVHVCVCVSECEIA